MGQHNVVGTAFYARARNARCAHRTGVTAYLPRILRVSITHIRFDIIGSNNLYSHLNSKSRPIGAMSGHYHFIHRLFLSTVRLIVLLQRFSFSIDVVRLIKFLHKEHLEENMGID